MEAANTSGGALVDSKRGRMIGNYLSLFDFLGSDKRTLDDSLQAVVKIDGRVSRVIRSPYLAGFLVEPSSTVH